ncbi:MAG: hypothetical protein KAY50_08360 [Chitinophagaceae bacterium]|nr:hypothetical protein [Chitinophagaceae bacterium]
MLNIKSNTLKASRDILLILLLFFLNIIVVIFYLNISTWFLLIGVVIFSVLLYYQFKNKYVNISRILFLFISVFGLLPTFHCVLYKFDKNHYRLNEDFLNHKMGMLKKKLENYKDSTLVRDFLVSQNLNLDSLPKNNTSIDQYKIIINTLSRDPRITVGRPNRLPHARSNESDFIFILDSNNRQILVDSFKRDFTLRSYLSNYLNKLSIDKSHIEKSEFIDDKDIWVESISGFLFGDIETLSTVTKFLRLVQLILFYFLLTFVSKFIEKTNWFEVKKI